MGLIDKVMPAARLRQIDRIAVAAEPARAWQAVRGLDLYSIGVVRGLFTLRLLPESLLARLRGQPSPRRPHARIEDIVTPGGGWLLLGEEEGREVVVGAVGKFWQPRIDYVPVAPQEFASFADRGFGKVAWSVRVDPRAAGGSWITVDLRVTATDDAAWARFQWYWKIVGPFSHAIRKAAVAMFGRRLGAPLPEQTMALPGDEILPGSVFQKTHASTIEVSPSALWPWLVQMGGQRAGWYSLDWLDNGGTPSARQILPELQKLAVGDLIPVHHKGDESFGVLRLDPGRLLVIGSPSLIPGGNARPNDPAPWQSSWAFHLQPIGDDATRLVVRVRARYQPSPEAELLARPTLSVLHEVMERAQLRNLKRRAEDYA